MINWTDITHSEYPHERRALEYLKQHLPAETPYRAWGPFEFSAGDRWPEVDCLVVGPHAIFLIEIKSWKGTVTGDAANWKRRWANGRTEEWSNPLKRADRTAKKLKGALEETKALRGSAMPRVVPLVFLSEDGFNCKLPQGRARDGITGVDRRLAPGSLQKGGLPGIVETIEAYASKQRVDDAFSRRIAKAMVELGIKPSERFTQIGEAVLDKRLRQDREVVEYTAHHEDKKSIRFRVIFHRSTDGVNDQDGGRAERAARREFDLLAPRDTRHPGLERAVKLDLDHPWGPAVVFETEAGSAALGEFIKARFDSLSAKQRVDLIRELAEAVQYAHSRHMFHRALGPSAIRIHKTADGAFQPVVIGWHAGLRAQADNNDLTAVPGTSHVTSTDEQLASYRAPESMLARPDPELLDVFSLGALAYLIITGSAPPANQLDAMEAAGGFLDPRSVDPGCDVTMCSVIEAATRGDASKRTPSVDELLRALDDADGSADSVAQEPDDAAVSGDHATPPKPQQNLHTSDLRPGMQLANFTIERRLPRGATAVAVVAMRDDGTRGVLKIAATEQDNEAVEKEGLVLRELHTHTIVKLIDGPLDLDDRKALFLREADLGTLRERLRDQAQIALDDAKRWGADLLDALEQLERVDQHHRDIKPDNIGLMSVGNSDQAVLLDFSLTGASNSQLELGTPPYLDPFLVLEERSTYDAAADRYAAAVVLYELLTGRTLQWGDGRTHPSFAESELNLDFSRFPEHATDQLTTFFTRATARSADDRFQAAKEMARDWETALETAAAAPPAPTHHGTRDDDEKQAKTEIVIGADESGFTVALQGRNLTKDKFAELLAEFRAINTRQEYSPEARLWHLYPTIEAATSIKRIAGSNLTQLSPAAIELAEATEEAASENGLRRTDLIMEVAGSDLLISILPAVDGARFDELKSQLKGLEGSLWDKGRRAWVVPPRDVTARPLQDLAGQPGTAVSTDAAEIVAALVPTPRVPSVRASSNETAYGAEAARATPPSPNPGRPASPQPTAPPADLPTVVIRASHTANDRRKRRRPSTGSSDIGLFRLNTESTTEPFVGATPANEKDVAGERKVYDATGPERIELKIADERFENGERQIRLLDSGAAGPRFERLTHGCRLTVAAQGALLRINLEQARMKDENWSGTFKASVAELDAGCGADTAAILEQFGVRKIGTRGEMLGDESSHKGKLCAFFPKDAELLPIAAYVITRLSPIYLRMPAR